MNRDGDLIKSRILLGVMSFFLTASFVFADYPPDVGEKIYSCGYNSLYLFLRLRGHDVSFETVKNNVAIEKNGTSFFDLQTGAAACNIKTQTVWCSYKTLQKLPYPLIAWIDKSGSQSHENVIGHFIVLISCTPKNITYLDGTSGEKIDMSASTFFNQWNGMVLMEQRASTSIFEHMDKVIFFAGLLSLFFLRFFNKKTMTMIFAGFILLTNGQVNAEGNIDGIWRKPENESVNAAYLLLRSNELPCDYKAIERELSGKRSLYAICDYTEIHGLSMQILHAPTPEVLNKISLPYLIHLSNEDNDKNEQLWNGNYLLVIGRGNKHFMVVECGTIQIAEVPDETIRRYWSGYMLALLPKQKMTIFHSLFFISSLSGIAILLIYFSLRYRFKIIAAVIVPILLIPNMVFAENTISKTNFSADIIKQRILESTDKIKSLRVYYRSEYYTNPDAPKGTYLYRRILAKSPCYLNHTNSHPCNTFSWDNDPFLQQAFIQDNIGYNIFPFKNTYFVMKLFPNEVLPGTLPGEFFFNATGIWPMEQRKAPAWNTIPVALRDVAKNPNYNSVRPQQEQVDGHWCHVLFWENHDYLWIDMKRDGVLLARETCYPETGVLMLRYELNNHQEAVPGIWIPRKLRNIQYDFSAKTEEGQKRKVIDGFFDVEEIEVNTLMDADFDFTPPPGALLTYDARDPDAKYPYQSVAGGQEMLDSLALWIRSNAMTKKQVASGFPWGWSVGLLAFPIIIFLEIQRRRKTK